MAKWAYRSLYHQLQIAATTLIEKCGISAEKVELFITVRRYQLMLLH